MSYPNINSLPTEHTINLENGYTSTINYTYANGELASVVCDTYYNNVLQSETKDTYTYNGNSETVSWETTNKIFNTSSSGTYSTDF